MTPTDTPYRLLGGPGSPYSLKMRAVLRYRRLPHRWIVPRGYIGHGGELSAAGKGIIPVLQYPDGQYRADSTPLILDLERRHPGERSVLPDDPAVAFLAQLIEDLGDELLVVAMFDLRWGSAQDQHFCATRQLSGWLGPMPHDALAGMVQRFTQRQVRARAGMVMGEGHEGLMAFYRSVIDVLEDMQQRSSYLFGERPSAADFGLYGQLSQCALDPSASAILRAHAPRTYQWTQSLDDAGGVDGDWAPREVWEPSVRRMLELVGHYHLPLLQAHHDAIERGEDECTQTIDGRTWRARAERYRHHCLVWLQRAWEALDAPRQTSVQSLLDETGCLPFLAQPCAGRVPVGPLQPR